MLFLFRLLGFLVGFSGGWKQSKRDVVLEVAEPCLLKLAVEHLRFFSPALGGQKRIQRTPFHTRVAGTRSTFQAESRRDAAVTGNLE